MADKIKTALISVSDKTGLDKLAKCLSSKGVKILSTGGTSKFIKALGIDVVDVADHTGFPEIMDGRVKTLHPKVHGGLLAIRDSKEHQKQAGDNEIEMIDMVVVNLYPFEETVAKGEAFEECIENIDIGGPSMVRSAAKNHKFVAIVTDPADYDAVITQVNSSGAVDDDFKKKLAAKAFARTASYDSAISSWFANQLGEKFPADYSTAGKLKEILRYGENPDQKAALYVSSGGGLADAKQLQGKELSYNNICDADAALELVSEFEDPAAVIIKHANPCGAAVDKNLSKAYEKALASDPVSAYGSIIAFNRELDEETTKLLEKLFVEVIIAPSISKSSLTMLEKKKNLRILIQKLPDPKRKELMLRNISGGFLVQERDAVQIVRSDFKVVTKRQPTQEEIEDMLFSFSVCKHVKSNAIVLVKNGATVGSGAGQMSRVDSVKIAAMKAKEFGENRAQGAVMASDAFLPFADGLLIAAEAGVKAVIQPGGSIRDEEVIKAADEHGIAMVFTGKRHFKH